MEQDNEIEIKPRTPGLWEYSAQNVTVSDSDEVGKAETHLLKLMTDPYYLEAFKRVKKKIPTGKAPATKGKLAAKLQRPEPPKRPAHRPKITDRQWADNILDSLDRLNKPLTIAICRKITKQHYPSAMPIRQEKVAQEFLQMLKNHKKKRNKTTV